MPAGKNTADLCIATGHAPAWRNLLPAGCVHGVFTTTCGAEGCHKKDLMCTTHSTCNHTGMPCNMASSYQGFFMCACFVLDNQTAIATAADKPPSNSSGVHVSLCCKRPCDSVHAERTSPRPAQGRGRYSVGMLTHVDHPSHGAAQADSKAPPGPWLSFTCKSCSQSPSRCCTAPPCRGQTPGNGK